MEQQINRYVRGYKNDAGIDIILNDYLTIRPGLNVVELPAKYTPGEGEVAFLVPRGSTAKKGVFPIMVAIDTDYTGIIHGFVVNISETTHVWKPGERAFGIVNLKLGQDRAKFTVVKDGKRTDEWNNSSGGNN